MFLFWTHSYEGVAKIKGNLCYEKRIMILSQSSFQCNSANKMNPSCFKLNRKRDVSEGAWVVFSLVRKKIGATDGYSYTL